MRPLIYRLSILALVVLVAASTFSAYSYYNAYQLTSFGVKKLSSVLTSTPPYTYGMVREVDLNNRTLTIAVLKKFSDGERTIVVRVRDDAVIGHQELLGKNGIYDALSTTVASSLTDVTLGTHIALVTETDATGALWTRAMLFGNPL